MNALSIKQLRIIEAIVECQSAMKAAEKLQMSSSSVSYSLKQIKKQLGRDLFYRTRDGLRPHTETLSLYSSHSDILNISKQQRNLVIATYSMTEMMLTDYMYKQKLNLTSPSLNFTPMCITNEERFRKLRHHEVDADIGSELAQSSSIRSKRLFSSQLCVIASKDHSELKHHFSLNNWLNCTHLSWLRGVGNISDMAMKVDNTLLEKRKIALSSPNLLTLASMCASSDHIMLMPEVFVAPLQKHFAIQAFRCPPEIAMVFDCYIHYRKSLETQIDALEFHKAF